MALHRGGLATMRPLGGRHSPLAGIRLRLIREGGGPWGDFWVCMIVKEDLPKVDGPPERTIHKLDLEEIN